MDVEGGEVTALKKSNHSKKAETLAEYYYRINRHLLAGVALIDIDVDN